MRSARLWPACKEASDRAASPSAGWPLKIYILPCFFYLGDIEQDRVSTLGNILDVTAVRFKALPFQVVGVGTFGTPKAPRMIWVGTGEGTDNLVNVQSDIAQKIKALGWDMEDRTYTPHLTLGRIKSAKRVDGLTSLLPSVKNMEFGWNPVSRLVVMSSWLRPAGGVLCRGTCSTIGRSPN